jgi:hypothetical protein
MSFWDIIKDKMTDDKGLFQGGKEGRMFGRVKDSADELEQERAQQVFNDNSFWNQKYQDRGDDTSLAMQKSMNENASPEEAAFGVNILKQQIDPQNKAQVMQLQNYLNKAGFSDYDGSELGVDGAFGYKTESALRKAQGKYSDEDYIAHKAKDSFGFGQPKSNRGPIAPEMAQGEGGAPAYLNNPTEDTYVGRNPSTAFGPQPTRQDF